MAKALLAVVIVLGGALMTADLVQAQERTGEQIVKQQCVSCHGTGANGAPRIDDRAAWAPRMKRGLDATVASATKGHGAMPARGGMADLTDKELRAAILYMFNPAGATAPKTAATPAPRDFNKQVVGDLEIFLGVSPAKSKGTSHITVRLLDAKTQAPINDARVEARVATTMGGSTKTLRREKVGDAVSYGNDFSMVGNETHTVTVTVTRPKASKAQARFEVRH